ncbi:MAG: hypothetical protein CMJ75_06790 [Planctomycetaceae bacterium]|nr:hypothetical protein [Planctomycetaceae bacterium]
MVRALLHQPRVKKERLLAILATDLHEPNIYLGIKSVVRKRANWLWPAMVSGAAALVRNRRFGGVRSNTLPGIDRAILQPYDRVARRWHEAAWRGTDQAGRQRRSNCEGAPLRLADTRPVHCIAFAARSWQPNSALAQLKNA